MARVKLLTLLLALLSICSANARADSPPRRETALPEEEVKDFFFGYFIGLLAADANAVLTADDLRSLAPEYDADPNFPFHRIAKVQRKPTMGSDHAEIRIDFTEEMEFDLPFDILGYRPGSISLSQTLRLRETRFPPLQVNRETRNQARLDLLWVLELRQGNVFFDFDGWLDTLAAGLIDDMCVRRLYVFRFDGSWYGVLEGVGHRGRIITGTYDFQQNRIVVPPPKELRHFSDNFAGWSADAEDQSRLPGP